MSVTPGRRISVCTLAQSGRGRGLGGLMAAWRTDAASRASSSRPSGSGQDSPADRARPHVIGDRRVRHLGRRGDLAQAQALAEAQPQDFSYLPHGSVGSGHRLLLGRRRGLSLQAAGDLSPHASATADLPRRVYENPETGVRNEPKRVYENPRNPQLTQSGQGTASTAKFTVPAAAGGWRLAWSYSCAALGSTGNFIIYVNGGSGNDQGVNELGMKGSSVEHYYDTGTFYLQISSECNWSIQAVRAGGC